MYDQFYGFSERPFSLLPDPDFLFLGDKHRAALDTLELAIFNHSGFCVISGAIGAGKTTLIRELLNRLNDDIQVGLVSNTHPSFGELMQWVMAAYGLPAGTDDPLELHKRFIDYIIQRYADGKHTLLIIDEAQNLSMAALEELRMLSNVNSEKDLVLQIILIGQSELREKLRKPELTQFAQRISIDYYLGGLTPDEAALYIQHRVVHAGGVADLFTVDACRRVFEISQGIPRVINRICDLSLVYGYAQHSEQIDAELVEAVVQEQHLGETMEAARQRATAPAAAVKPVVEAMALAEDNDSAADALIGKIDSILATGVRQTDRKAAETGPTRVKQDAPLKAEDVETEVSAPVQKPDHRTVSGPEPEIREVHSELQPKVTHADKAAAKSADLHTLVVNAEKSAGTRGERGALWLFLGVAAMVAITAWVSRDAWLPVAQDVAALNEQGVAEQARQEKARHEEAARLARQQAARKAKQEQVRQEKAQRKKAARLARQQAAGKAKQEQARQEKAQRKKAARLARQQAARKAKLEQARQEKAQREEAARLAKQQTVRQRVTPATWADTPEWSEEDDEEFSVTPVTESATADSPPPKTLETTTAVAVTLSGDEDKTDSAPEPEGFSTNPCNGPTARFLSTCR